MSEHAVFSPSAAERWIACPASHLRSLAVPRLPSTVYSERGTLLHDLAACGVTSTLKAMDAVAGRKGVVLDADERAALAVYVKFCKGLRKGAALWRVEEKIKYSDELFGTLDFWALKDETLHVVDLKTGRGVHVDAVDNPQLLTYAMLVLNLLDQVGVSKVSRVHLHIVQPLYASDAPIRSVRYNRAELDAWAAGVVKAMAAAKEPDAPFNPGEHCRFCPVKPVCPALQGLAMALPAPLATGSLPPARLADWLTKADTIEMWIAALREHAHGIISAGVAVPGWKLVDKRATRKWTDEEQVMATAIANGIRAQELKLLSPTQLEKKYRTIPVALVKFVDQTPSGKNLVRDSTTVVAPDTSAPKLDSALLNLQYRV